MLLNLKGEKTMSEEETDRPFHILGVLNGEENFHSGYSTKVEAEMRLKLANEEAVKLGIKTRYVLRKNIKTQ